MERLCARGGRRNVLETTAIFHHGGMGLFDAVFCVGRRAAVFGLGEERRGSAGKFDADGVRVLVFAGRRRVRAGVFAV